MIETHRKVVARDFLIFQLKLALDAGKDAVVFGLSIAFAATSFFLTFFSFGGGATI